MDVALTPNHVPAGTVSASGSITLNALGSTDPNLLSGLQYTWNCTSGNSTSPCQLSTTATAALASKASKLSFPAPSPGSYTFHLQ